MKKIGLLLGLVSTVAWGQNSILDHVDSNLINNRSNDNQIASTDGKYCDGTMLFNQVETTTSGFFSDLDCDVGFCPSGIQIIAEDFILTADNRIGEFVIHGGYFSGNTPITDIWNFTIYGDNAGTPDLNNIIYTEADISSTREDSGVDLFGVDSYRFILTPTAAIPMTAGTYWVEIYNDSTGSADSVFWQTGDLEPNSIAGNVFSTVNPVAYNNDAQNLAMQFCQEAFDLNVNVTGLAATNSVTLANDKDVLEVSTNGTSKISGLSDTVAYNVTVTQQPDTPDQICTVTSGTGNMTSSGASVDVNCVTVPYNVDINVSGLAPTNSVSFSNGGDTLTISTDGTETISTLDDESAYDVDITAQPDTPNQVCGFDNADAGNLAGGDATVNVSCVTTQYTVGVNVSGLAGGNSVVFQNNTGDDLNVNANGVSTFTTSLDDGSAYNVTVLTQPTMPNQTCVVTGSMGNLAGGNAELAVACTTNQYNVDINVSGLAATNSVSFSNGGDTLTINADSTETISTLNDGSAFDVDITAQPDTPNQVCSFDNADTGNLAGGDATVNVSCVTTQYTVGVNVSGLAGGNSVVFQNNTGDDLNVNANGVSTFTTSLDDGSAYNVTVLTQPTMPNQTCVVTGPMGNLAGGNAELAVACTTNQYNVDINVSGLAATNSVSFSNGGDTLNIAADGTQTITTSDDGTAFDVDITAQPDTPNQVCSFDNADAGNLAGGDATVNVSCVTTQYTVGVNVSGLAGGNSVVFQNNTGDDLNVNANGVSTFATSLDDGSAYNVTVLTQPTMPNQTCVVTGPMGNLAGGNAELAVACTSSQYDVNISVTGLAATNSVSFSNGGDSLTINTDGTETITMADDGSAFDVDITAQPDTPNQVCGFDNADTGNLAGGDATVNVSCVTTQYPIYIKVTGLEANNSVSFTNGGDSLIVSDSNLNIISTIDDGAAYEVNISSQPTSPNQVCSVNSGNDSGNIDGAHIEIYVSCVISEYFIGGSVTGLLKNSMLLIQNNMEDNKIIICNGPFAFNAPLEDLSGYDVTVHTQPQSPMQECTISQGSGMVSGDDVISIEIDCDYTISGDYIFSSGFDGSPFCEPGN